MNHGRALKSVHMVCSQMPPVYGGAGAQATLLGTALARLGWTVTALTLDQEGVGDTVHDGVVFRRLLRGVVPTSRWTRLLTTVTLGVAAFVRVLIDRPAVVHVHGAYWWSIPPVIAGRLTGARVVVKLTRDGEDDAQTIYSKRIGPFRVGRIYGLSVTLADLVVVLNEQAWRIAATNGLAERTRLILNGVDDAALTRTPARRKQSRAAHALPEDERVVMFVGYLVRHKGIFDLLEAWRVVGRREHHLWLVGPYDGFYRELDGSVPALVSELVRDGFRVRLFGHVPAAELAELYWAADVFTLPSYAEGMPNSLAEAAVAGCHIVATRIPGITDLLGSESEDLVLPGDVQNLSERLAAAILCPQHVPAELVERLRMTNIAQIYDRLYVELNTAEAR